ncbi:MULTISPECIES: hypothetical protein [unclassified Leptolyngbya]|uniref:hypothetical protein n=1 Tax=unclassified Leptolyngbya TaxID=2650499 RepID=UPI0016856635|nr:MULTISPECIES: hypothetical protein [unclassified Leptolyngbya]MBD1911667.1 hypothetical protein [Leptolyngbya sp. FACHB-8]MBD2154594.1 hypothetical protein [Leptolyngbya sp. FACHB-16]
MSERQLIPIAKDFFCDGYYYVLTSSSLANSGLKPEELATILGESEPSHIEDVLRRGICIPLFFDGDCALDNHTIFVLGDLTEAEERDWIGRISWKLSIPCGKLILQCGGGDEEDLAHAISGRPPEPNYQFFQVIDVLPGEYQVNVYAYLSSMTVQVFLHPFIEAEDRMQRYEAMEAWYKTHRPGPPDIGYIIQLTPLEQEPPFPDLVPEIGWCGFEFREPDHVA